MKKWTVEALSLAGIAILLAFLAGFTFLTWQDLKQSRAASDLVDDTHATLAWLGQFRAELYRTELFERSLRDGAPGALAQRDAALDALARQLQGADRLSDAVAGRRARLIQLQQWVRLRILPDTRAARLLGAGQGDAVRDQQDQQDAHLMLDAMLGIEHATLADAELAETRQNDGARNRFLLLILVAGGVIAAILLRIRTLTLARNAAIDLLEHSEHRYRHLLDTAHEGVWLLDNTGRSTFVNERLAHMLGCGAPELLGQPVQAYLGMDAGAALADILRCRAGTVSRSHDLCYRRKNGTRGWALVSGSALASERGEREGSLLMLTDISARKSAEQALARAHAGLEIMRWTTLRVLSHATDAPPPPVALTTKLSWACWHRDLGNLAMDVLGAHADLAEPGGGHELTAAQRLFLFTRSDTIYAGSNQIQRNIIGERGLGLPREPAPTS